MRLQETYLEKSISNGQVIVIKTYDEEAAREAFDDLSESALERVTAAMDLASLYDPEDLPSSESPDYRDFLWETLSDEAREEGQIKSFFIVTRVISGRPPESLFVSADWPSAEIFVQGL